MKFWSAKSDGDQPKTKKDYEKLGREIVYLYESLSPRRGAVYRTAFFRGLAGGVGGVVGATVGIAILLWTLSLFESLPLIGGFMESLQRSIKGN